MREHKMVGSAMHCTNGGEERVLFENDYHNVGKGNVLRNGR
jgi:hypothetical protein